MTAFDRFRSVSIAGSRSEQPKSEMTKMLVFLAYQSILQHYNERERLVIGCMENGKNVKHESESKSMLRKT